MVDMLNCYFNHMCEIIYRQGGTVDKFMGDSIMALFGAPVNRPNYIEHAVCCVDTYEGLILNISSGGTFACTLAEVELYSNMRFRLEFNILGVKSSDIYARFSELKRAPNSTR